MSCAIIFLEHSIQEKNKEIENIKILLTNVKNEKLNYEAEKKKRIEIEGKEKLFQSTINKLEKRNNELLSNCFFDHNFNDNKKKYKFTF
jgi:hypothetical protein